MSQMHKVRGMAARSDSLGRWRSPRSSSSSHLSLLLLQLLQLMLMRPLLLWLVRLGWVRGWTQARCYSDDDGGMKKQQQQQQQQQQDEDGRCVDEFAPRRGRL